jgi:hypothetical protein
MRLFIVDTLATIIFFTIIATFTELVIAGMAPGQVLITRAIMMLMMVVTARPYSAWRDWVFRKMLPRRRIGRAFVDVVAFMAFQVPLYAATLALAGADLGKIVTALGSATLFMLTLSRPFGLFLEWVRRLAHVVVPGRP